MEPSSHLPDTSAYLRRQGPVNFDRLIEVKENEIVLIGRCAESIFLSSTYISRRHAEIWNDGDSWFIQDLESFNGIYIYQDSRVQKISHQPFQLKNGAVIGFGLNPMVWHTKEMYMEDPDYYVYQVQLPQQSVTSNVVNQDLCQSFESLHTVEHQNL